MARSLWLRGLNYLLCPFIALQYCNFYMYSNYSYSIIFTYTYLNNVGHCSSCMVCKLLSLSNQGFISQSTQEHPTCACFLSLLRRVNVLDKLQRHLYQEGFLSLSTFYFLLSLGSRYVFCPIYLPTPQTLR